MTAVAAEPTVEGRDHRHLSRKHVISALGWRVAASPAAGRKDRQGICKIRVEGI